MAKSDLQVRSGYWYGLRPTPTGPKWLAGEHPTNVAYGLQDFMSDTKADLLSSIDTWVAKWGKPGMKNNPFRRSVRDRLAYTELDPVYRSARAKHSSSDDFYLANAANAAIEAELLADDVKDDKHLAAQRAYDNAVVYANDNLVPTAIMRKEIVDAAGRMGITLTEPNPAAYTTTATAMPFYQAGRRYSKSHPGMGANDGLKRWLGELPATLRSKRIPELKDQRAVEAWHVGWVDGQSYGDKFRALTAVRNPELTVSEPESITLKKTPSSGMWYVYLEFTDGSGHAYTKLHNRKQDAEAELVRVLSQVPGLKRKENSKSNPESQASAAYQAFHGKPSEEILEFETPVHVHENLAAAGDLVELHVRVTQTFKSGKSKDVQVDLNFAGCGVLVAFDESGIARTAPGLVNATKSALRDLGATQDNILGRQLYFVGGDQSLPLADIGMSGPEWEKELMVIGRLVEITYRTQKSFDEFQTIDYYHGLGEVTKVTPTLLYRPGRPDDGVPPSMEIAGGQYTIQDIGIVN